MVSPGRLRLARPASRLRIKKWAAAFLVTQFHRRLYFLAIAANYNNRNAK
jgi:hypothetical protein